MVCPNRCADPVTGIEFAWLRRGRVDADLWQEGDIPLSEAVERYRVRILAQGEVLREAYPEQPV